ncbi:MAG: DUF2007 domain-containing protein [Bacteroidetes bacterium]|nr:DUF2007 domain-containing protein [Bacteroidota bacterium]MBU1680595.1 DUF2007 domain-containing protein [Bacteroidota bacterium]MBU2507632.1 DUF2007 domain-containing protein [Bacteroidota bacterium]
MICPNCESEYVDGIAECTDCGSELVSAEEFEGNLVHHSDWVIVYTCSESFEADMLKANLEGAGIEVTILKQKDSSYPAVGGLAVIKVLVQKKDAETASEIITDINKTE